jgi:hypothetical protein
LSRADEKLADVAETRVTDSTRLKIGAAFALAAAVAYWLPRAAEDGTQPPLSMLVVAGALIAALTTGILFAALRFDFALPVTVALYAVAYNGLIVAVKFVFGPAGLYEVNQSVDLSSDLSDPAWAALGGVFVLGLYAAVYYALYRLTRRRLERRPDDARSASRSRAWIVLPILVAGYLFAGGGVLVVLAIPLFFASGGIEYVQFVFSSTYGLATGLALAGATGLAALAFRDVGERARVAGDIGVLVAFFWVGLAFLVLYQALWVVYVLVLTSLWPLRVVVPK